MDRGRSSAPATCAGVALVAFAALIAIAPAVVAAEQVESVDRYRYLRQLSLDLLRRVPSVEELAALDGVDDVDEAMIDALIAHEDFDALIQRHHLDLLWPNFNDFELVSPAIALLLPATFYDLSEPSTAQAPGRLFTIYTGLYDRGGFVPCGDWPAEFDADGDPILVAQDDGTMRDGYVMMSTYWSDGEPVAVCALEARTIETNPVGLACSTAEGMLTGGCGCGADLRHCIGVDQVQDLMDSLQDQVLRSVRRPIAERRSYFDILTDTSVEVDGRIVHFYRYLAPMAIDPIVLVPPVPVAALPEVGFTDPTWHEVSRESVHSGVLTNLLFLLRFQTGRARAARFWDAFLCEPFQAPGISLPSPSDPCSAEPDLRKRCGCNGCHASLEPATAYWARFTDAGTLYLNPFLFPVVADQCATCAHQPAGCDSVCRRFYLTEAGHPALEPYLGTLQTFVFRDEDEVAAANEGPAGLVATYLANGKLSQCTTMKLYERFFGRPMNVEERMDVLPALVDAFEASGQDFITLVKAIVMTDGYRRMTR
jgi:hypothetical protein